MSYPQTGQNPNRFGDATSHLGQIFGATGPKLLKHPSQLRYGYPFSILHNGIKKKVQYKSLRRYDGFDLTPHRLQTARSGGSGKPDGVGMFFVIVEQPSIKHLQHIFFLSLRLVLCFLRDFR